MKDSPVQRDPLVLPAASRRGPARFVAKTADGWYMIRRRGLMWMGEPINGWKQIVRGFLISLLAAPATTPAPGDDKTQTEMYALWSEMIERSAWRAADTVARVMMNENTDTKGGH